MAYQWTEFLELAKSLTGETSEPHDEAKLRSAISRAYYCIFNLALEKAAAKWNYRASFDRNSHEELIRHLKARPERIAQRTGRDLERLRPLRVEADYRSVIEDAPGKAQTAINTAKDVSSWILQVAE